MAGTQTTQKSEHAMHLHVDRCSCGIVSSFFEYRLPKAGTTQSAWVRAVTVWHFRSALQALVRVEHFNLAHTTQHPGRNLLLEQQGRCPSGAGGTSGACGTCAFILSSAAASATTGVTLDCSAAATGSLRPRTPERYLSASPRGCICGPCTCEPRMLPSDHWLFFDTRP